MEVNRHVKAQLLSLMMLILFVLMLSILMTFAILQLNYSSVSQSISLSGTTTNYAELVQPSLYSFTKASAARALATIAGYDLRPSLSSGSTVTNLNASMASLITTGTLPGILQSSPAGSYISNSMSTLTLASFNSMLLSSINATYRIVSINQTYPNVTQYTPYNLSVTFIERVTINSTTGTYKYAIPVNVSVPLSGTADLLYAERGIFHYITFNQSGVAVSAIPGVLNASSGNTTGYVYGTVYQLPAGVTCSSGAKPIGNYISTTLQNSPLNKTIIIVTSDASQITSSSCNIADNFGGLITYNVNTISPAALSVPYLVYSSGTGAVLDLETGEQILLYGPGLSALNESGLRSAYYNGYYFSSPLAASYSARVNGSLASPSPEGLFNLMQPNLMTGYGSDLDDGVFNGQSSYISTGTSDLPSGAAPRSVFAWVYMTGNAASTPYVYSYGAASSDAEAALGISPSNDIDLYADGYSTATTLALTPDQWYFIGYTYALSATQATVYLDGQYQAASIGTSLSSAVSNSFIGSQVGGVSNFFKGSIADVQVYNSVLSSNQVQSLYSEGLAGNPVQGTTANIIGWWQMDGSANDLSGIGNSGTATSVGYKLVANYTYDSVYGIPVSAGNANPLPGLLTCSNNAQCSSNTLPHIYLLSQPLQPGGTSYSAQFNGNSYVSTTGTDLPVGNSARSVFAWIYYTGTTGNEYDVYSYGAAATGERFQLTITSNVLNVGVYGSGINSGFAIPRNQWSFVGISYVPNTVTFYYDVQSQQATLNGVDTVLSGSPVSVIGATSGVIMPNFQGDITDVQLYNVSLTSSQVTSLYQEGPAGVPIMPSNIVGWWPLNGNPNDYSGNGNNGNAVSTGYTPFTGNEYVPGITGTSTFQNEPQFFGLSQALSSYIPAGAGSGS